MSQDEAANERTIRDLGSAEVHLKLAMPIKDGFCRFYGTYVAVNESKPFPSGVLKTCIATETWDPA